MVACSGRLVPGKVVVVSRKIWICIQATAVFAVNGHAAEEMLLENSHVKPPAHLAPDSADDLWGRFTYKFDSYAPDLFADAVHPLKMMRLELRTETSEDFLERSTSAARDALLKSISYAARDVAVETPFMEWLAERQSFLAGLLRNSVGNAAEEKVSPLDPGYGATEQSWWRRLAENGNFRYGLRPFRTNPYAFASMAVRDEDKLLFMTHIRYHYNIMADHELELALSMPLSHGYFANFGTSYEFGGNKSEKQLVVKISKEFADGGIFHVGVELKQNPVMLAGVSVPF